MNILYFLLEMQTSRTATQPGQNSCLAPLLRILKLRMSGSYRARGKGSQYVYYVLAARLHVNNNYRVRQKFWPLYVWACCMGPDWLTVTRLPPGTPITSSSVARRHRFTPPSQESLGQKRARRELPARRGRWDDPLLKKVFLSTAFLVDSKALILNISSN